MQVARYSLMFRSMFRKGSWFFLKVGSSMRFPPKPQPPNAAIAVIAVRVVVIAANVVVATVAVVVIVEIVANAVHAMRIAPSRVSKVLKQPHPQQR